MQSRRNRRKLQRRDREVLQRKLSTMGTIKVFTNRISFLSSLFSTRTRCLFISWKKQQNQRRWCCHVSQLLNGGWEWELNIEKQNRYIGDPRNKLFTAKITFPNGKEDVMESHDLGWLYTEIASKYFKEDISFC